LSGVSGSTLPTDGPQPPCGLSPFRAFFPPGSSGCVWFRVFEPFSWFVRLRRGPVFEPFFLVMSFNVR